MKSQNLLKLLYLKKNSSNEQVSCRFELQDIQGRISVKGVLDLFRNKKNPDLGSNGQAAGENCFALGSFHKCY